MKNIDKKIQQCDILIQTLVKIKDINNVPCNRYYFVLRIWQELKTNKTNQLNEISRIKRDQQINVSSNKCYFYLPELKITSTTYERAKKRLENQIDNRFKNRITI